MLRADDARSRRIGIGLMSLATLCFALLDTSAKWLVQSLPVTEVVWLRLARTDPARQLRIARRWRAAGHTPSGRPT